MRLIDLFEYRRNNTPKQNAFEILKKYKDRDDIYISFTKIDKLGLNPKTQWSTPVGIYSYPIKAAWEKYNIDKLGIKGFPWAAKEPYIWVFEANVKDISNLTEQDFNNLVDYIFVNDMNNSAIDKYLNSETIAIYKKNEKWGDLVWRISREAVVRRTPNSEKGYYNVNKWSKLLLDLGYGGLSDKEGKGIIHSNEPCQAVFFTTKAIKIVEKIYNNNPLTKEHGDDIAQQKRRINSLSEDEFFDKMIHGGDEESMVDGETMIKYRKNLSLGLQLKIYDFSPRLATLIKDLDPAIQMSCVNYDGSYIRCFPNASLEVQMAAAKHRSDDDAIKGMKNVKPEVIKYIIDYNPMMIPYIKDEIPPKLQMYALEKNINLYKQFKNPCHQATKYYNEHKGTK